MDTDEVVYCEIDTCVAEAVTERTDDQDGKVYHLCSQCAHVWDLAQQAVSIEVQVSGGVAYCDDPRVEINDFDNERR